MSIVTMKHLHVMALEADKELLFDRLQKLGCVDVSEQKDKLQDPEWAALFHSDESSLEEQREKQSLVSGALSVLDTWAPVKTGLLTPLPQVAETELFRPQALEKALAAAREIRDLSGELTEVESQLQKQLTQLKSLEPWLPLDVPLNTSSTQSVFVSFGMLPASVDLEAVKKDLRLHAEESELYEASTDSEMHYLFFLCHRAREEEALDVLKSYGFSATVFKGITGTARETWDLHDARRKQLLQQKESIAETLRACGGHRSELELCYDRLCLIISREEAKQRLLSMDQTFLLDGWAALPDAPRLEALLKEFDCAYELLDPTEEEYPEVPIKLKNGPLTRSMNVVTEMYSLPAYDGVDPNPLMAPFFIAFFGMMMADMGYGLLMILAAIVGIAMYLLKKKK